MSHISDSDKSERTVFRSNNWSHAASPLWPIANFHFNLHRCQKHALFLFENGTAYPCKILETMRKGGASTRTQYLAGESKPFNPLDTVSPLAFGAAFVSISDAAMD
jgi:hypothetical protein